MMDHLKRRGSGLVLLVFLLIGGALAIYIGYGYYMEKYYLAFYDDGMTRYLDLPPFSKRLDARKNEYKGICRIEIGISPEQANLFFKSICRRRGFSFKDEKGHFVLEVRPGYKVMGTYEDSKLFFAWRPLLTAKQKIKFKSLFGEDYVEPVLQTDKKGKKKYTKKRR